MNQVYEKLLSCYESVKKEIDFVPQVAVVLGSGLGDYVKEIEVVKELPYEEIEGFPKSTVEGHAGKFLFGYLQGIRIVCMQGRVHYYEGYSISDVVLPIRLMKLMGAEVLFLPTTSFMRSNSVCAKDVPSSKLLLQILRFAISFTK